MFGLNKMNSEYNMIPLNYLRFLVAYPKAYGFLIISWYILTQMDIPRKTYGKKNAHSYEGRSFI